VDQVVDGGSKGVLSKAVDFGQTIGQNAATGVWGLLKREIYMTALSRLSEDIRQIMPFEEDTVAKAML